MDDDAPAVGIIMGSQSDWETMRHAADMLDALEVAHETRIVSAPRTSRRLVAYAKGAASRGLRVIIAGAGGAAHLPGMAASMTLLPVLGVPVESKALSGMDSLLSIVQMPAGVAVGTLAIGKAGAVNAGLLAAAILATTDELLAARLGPGRPGASGAGGGRRGTLVAAARAGGPGADRRIARRAARPVAAAADRRGGRKPRMIVAPGSTIGIVGGG